MNSPKRILLLYLASQSPGGVNTRLRAMASHLSPYYDLSQRPLHIPPGFLLTLFTSPLASFRRLNLFISFIRSFDAVISFSLLPNLISSLISRRSILSITGSAFYSLDTAILSRAYWTFFLQPISLLLADAIVPVSPAVTSPFHLLLPFLKRKVYPIYGFLDCAHIEDVISRPPLAHSYPAFPYFLFLGSLTRQKGILELIQIYSLFKRLYPSSLHKLLVCGDGPLLETSIQKCRELSLTSSFLHSSTTDDSEVIYELNSSNSYRRILSSSAVVCPYSFEGLSNTILESVYLQKPVLASSNPSTTYIQKTLSMTMSKTQSVDDNLLRLLPHPSNSHIHQWANALDMSLSCRFTNNATRDPVRFIFSASSNLVHWRRLIDSLLQGSSPRLSINTNTYSNS